MELILLIVQGVSGTIGGSVVGIALSEGRRRCATYSLLGAIGGCLGGQLMNILGVGTGPLDGLMLLANVASGGLSGALVTFIVASAHDLLTK